MRVDESSGWLQLIACQEVTDGMILGESQSHFLSFLKKYITSVRGYWIHVCLAWVRAWWRRATYAPTDRMRILTLVRTINQHLGTCGTHENSDIIFSIIISPKFRRYWVKRPNGTWKGLGDVNYGLTTGACISLWEFHVAHAPLSSRPFQNSERHAHVPQIPIKRHITCWTQDDQSWYNNTLPSEEDIPYLLIP